MTYQLGSALFVVATTGVLSVGQAWAVRAENGRALRLFLVWIAACYTMLVITAAIFDVWHAPPNSRRGAIESILVIAGVLAFIALAAGARWGAARARGASNLRHAAGELVGIHTAVVFFGGAIGTLVLVVWLLARVRW